MFVAYASETWPKSYGLIYTKFWAFWQKISFFNHFWQSVDAILEDVSVAKTTINFQTTIF